MNLSLSYLTHLNVNSTYSVSLYPGDQTFSTTPNIQNQALTFYSFQWDILFVGLYVVELVGHHLFILDVFNIVSQVFKK